MKRRWSLLVVEDDATMRRVLVRHLGRSHEVHAAATIAEARKLFARHRVDLAVVDLRLPDGDGHDLVTAFRTDDEAAVVVVTAFPQVQEAVRALKAGAFDFISKPFELDAFDIVIEKALSHRGLQGEVAALRRTGSRKGGVDAILGASRAIELLRHQICQVAATPDTTVLVRGETGTGKELVAEAVHAESARHRGPLVRLNCSSIPATMLESELFGHERGAFTDAKQARRGLVEIADGGTLFLDEVGDLPLALQPKLLRVLESRSCRRVGGNREIRVDVRFVAATNRPLEEMVRARTFREDLLFRLKVFELRIPPLRERPDDVAVLTAHLLGDLGRRMSRDICGASPDAAALLGSYRWPGNVRELRNVLERAVILAQSPWIGPADLPGDLQTDAAPSCRGRCPLHPDGVVHVAPLADVEQEYIRCVYEMAGGNKSQAARMLGISRVTLREKLRRLEGEPPAT